ncbi:unnamed protein product [Arctogadus glacialis]
MDILPLTGRRPLVSSQAAKTSVMTCISPGRGAALDPSAGVTAELSSDSGIWPTGFCPTWVPSGCARGRRPHPHARDLMAFDLAEVDLP